MNNATTNNHPLSVAAIAAGKWICIESILSKTTIEALINLTGIEVIL